MIEKKLKDGTFVKIIAGLGNTALEEIKALGAIYSRVGIDMFDITADEDVINALYEGIKSQKLNPKDFAVCVSFSFADDIHGSKAQIESSICTKCGKCIEKCPHHAISKECKIIQEKCIGCRQCSKCPAITYNKIIHNPVKVLKKIKDFEINTVELHVNGLSKEKIIQEIKNIKKEFPQIQISLCMTYNKRPIKEVKEIIQKVCSIIAPQNLIFQADGKAMSGITDDIFSAKSAVDFAKELLKLPNTYIILSGGCNDKTKSLVKKENMKVSGIAYGSFARILAEPYVKNSEFWYNIDVINKAIEKCSILNDNNC